MRVRRLLPLLVLILPMAGCGGSHPQSKIPPALIGAPPESARTPEGARPQAPPSIPPAFSLNPRHISSNGLHLIEGFEGWSSCPYWDPYGRVWTRGFGETEGITQHSACITRAQGEANLRNLVESRYEWALRGLGVPLNQNQWDALDSFIWNVGAGIFEGTTLGRQLRAHEYFAATRTMLLYDHAGGQVLEGLRTRREREVKLFLTSEGPSQKKLELWRLYRLRSELRADLAKHGGSDGPPQPPSYAHAWATWKAEGNQVNAAIRQLHQEGVF